MPHTSSQTFLRELGRPFSDLSRSSSAKPDAANRRDTDIPVCSSAYENSIPGHAPKSFPSAFLGDLCALAVKNSSSPIRHISNLFVGSGAYTISVLNEDQRNYLKNKARVVSDPILYFGEFKGLN